MESLFMARASCRLSSPPPPQPFYCPTQNKRLTADEKNICLSPAKPHPLPDSPSESHSNETTPTTHWHLQSVYRGEGGEEGEGESSLSSQYNESWQTTSTTDTSGRREGGGREEGEREIAPGSGVDGATGQCAIAKYIDRFRTAPPTPREERRKSQSGGTQNFWWQAPLQNSPSGPPAATSPSPPLSHSTPTNTSSSSSSAAGAVSRQSSLDNSEASASSLEARSQQALQKSSSLLASGSSGAMLTHSHAHAAPRGKQTAASLLPPSSLPPSSLPCGGSGKGDDDEDILHQWRLRRRLEQAHRHTARLTAQLSGSGPPLFTAQTAGTASGCVGGGMARGIGLSAAYEGQSGRGYVRDGRRREGREDSTRERRQGETRDSHNVQEPEQRVERSLQRTQPQQRDETQDSDPPSSPPLTSAPRPPVQYPSPSLLDHIRRSSRARSDHHTKPHPHNEAEDEVSLSLSETVFDSNGHSTPAHFHSMSSPKSGMGELVSQAVQQHLFQPGYSADESIVLTAGAVEGGYDDLGDGLLRVLIARSVALEQQLRQIHTLLSAVEES